MRILVVTNLYPPVVRGGYEVECSSVVDHLRERHEVHVLTSSHERSKAPAATDVDRALALLADDARGVLRAPGASLRAVAIARRALQRKPDLVYLWNCSQIPQAALRVIADSGVPLAVRVCEHWFGRLFRADQFMRELLPAPRGLGHATWALGCRALNRLPSLRLDPLAPVPLAISWNSEAIRRMAGTPTMARPVLERVGHSVPRHGERFESVTRSPAGALEIAYLGRVTYEKGIETAVEALAALRARHGLSARLVVAGREDPESVAYARSVAERLGVADAIDWRGPVDEKGAASILGRADALIVPSRWEEPFPLVTIEGAFARVPIVASDVGGIGEGMHDEEHALLFAPGDPEAAADALARVLSEPEQTAARVARAYDRAQEFRLGPYLDAQEQFVLDALEAFRGTANGGGS